MEKPPASSTPLTMGTRLKGGVKSISISGLPSPWPAGGGEGGEATDVVGTSQQATETRGLNGMVQQQLLRTRGAACTRAGKDSPSGWYLILWVP